MTPSLMLEATMLICFGFAWPLANLRMLRTRTVQAQSMLPTSLILCGYLAGIAAKVVCSSSGDPLAPIFWLYVLNAGSVGFNVGLQLHFRRRPLAAAAGVGLTR